MEMSTLYEHFLKTAIMDTELFETQESDETVLD